MWWLKIWLLFRNISERHWHESSLYLRLAPDQASPCILIVLLQHLHFHFYQMFVFQLQTARSLLQIIKNILSETSMIHTLNLNHTSSQITWFSSIKEKGWWSHHLPLSAGPAPSSQHCAFDWFAFLRPPGDCSPHFPDISREMKGNLSVKEDEVGGKQNKLRQWSRLDQL